MIKLNINIIHEDVGEKEIGIPRILTTQVLAVFTLCLLSYGSVPFFGDLGPLCSCPNALVTSIPQIGPLPPAREWGSCVSGLVNLEKTLVITLSKLSLLLYYCRQLG